MSSFANPHHFYLFAMKNGRKKLGYGSTAEEALEILRYRLTEEELSDVDPDRCTRIAQRELREHIHELG